MNPKYPHVNVPMKGIETRGILSAMAAINAAVGKVSRFEVAMFREEMREAKDINEAVAVCKRWFTLIGPASPRIDSLITTPPDRDRNPG